MKTKKQKIWIYWWWVRVGLSDGSLSEPWINTTYSRRLHTANRMQAYHKEDGGKCGRMHRMQVEIEEALK
jgi:hypothetical protein